MAVYLDDELDTLTAQPIIDRLMKTIDEIRHNIFNNYVQDYTIENENEKYFFLDYIPLVDTLFVMINGVAYTNTADTQFFIYDELPNRVTWVYPDIPLEPEFRLSIVYSFDMDVNNTNVVEVINNGYGTSS